MHSRISGLSDYLAVDELDGLRIARGIVKHLRWRKLGPGPTEPADDPLYDPAELLGCASADVRVPFDIREIYARLLDGSRFEEFKPLYGDKLVCGWGVDPRLPGRRCSATTGSCSRRRPRRARSSSSSAIAPTRRSCSCTTSPGSWSASKAEQGGIIRNGAKMINAVSNSERAALLPDGRRLVRRRQLRHVGPRLRPALHLLVAEPPHRRDGRPPARRRDGHRRSQRRSRTRRRRRRGGSSTPRRRRSRRRSSRSRRRCSPPAASGTTGSSIPPIRGRCSGWPCRRRTRTSCAAPPSTACGGTDDPSA